MPSPGGRTRRFPRDHGALPRINVQHRPGGHCPQKPRAEGQDSRPSGLPLRTLVMLHEVCSAPLLMPMACDPSSSCQQGLSKKDSTRPFGGGGGGGCTRRGAGGGRLQSKVAYYTESPYCCAHILRLYCRAHSVGGPVMIPKKESECVVDGSWQFPELKTIVL